MLTAYSGIFVPHLRSRGSAPMWYLPSRNKDAPPPTLDDAITRNSGGRRANRGDRRVHAHESVGTGLSWPGAAFDCRLNAARDRGARVFMDVYPYASSGSDGEFIALPEWIFDQARRAADANKPFDYRAAFEAAAEATADPAGPR